MAKVDAPALEAYDRLLTSIGDMAEAIGPKGLASHWPHVGNNYGGLVIAGQALQGWDPAVKGARWQAADAKTAEGRARIIEDTRTWHADAEDPVGAIATLSNRRESPFWRLCHDLADALQSDLSGPWYSRMAWANVYPVGPDDPPGSPGGPLREAQDPLVGDLFAALLDSLHASRVVIICGPEYWRYASRSPAFAGLKPQSFPLISGARLNARTIVVGYHPTYARRKGVGARAYADQVVETILAIERGIQPRPTTR